MTYVSTNIFGSSFNFICAKQPMCGQLIKSMNDELLLKSVENTVGKSKTRGLTVVCICL